VMLSEARRRFERGQRRSPSLPNNHGAIVSADSTTHSRIAGGSLHISAISARCRWAAGSHRGLRLLARRPLCVLARSSTIKRCPHACRSSGGCCSLPCSVAGPPRVVRPALRRSGRA
jgi:hypothetical protein